MIRNAVGVAAVVLAMVGLSSPARAEISLRATLTPQRAQVGEPVTLSIEVSGARSVAAPAVQVDGFDVRYIGPMTQMSIVNGTVNSSVQHRYALTPLREGTFTVGPVSVDYEGKTYRTAGVRIEVTSAGARAQGPASGSSATSPGGLGARALRLELSVPQREIYLHERLPVDLTLYVGAARVADLQYPTLAAEGLSLEKFQEPTKRQQVIDGETYQVLQFRSTAVPLRAGSLALGPASMQMNVLTPRRSPFGNDPLFQHFADPFAERRPVEARSEAVMLNVLPLPEEGKPAAFSGAVGTFTLEVTASPTEVTAGDPITLRLRLTGNGNLAEASPPELSSTEGFRTYETRPVKTAEAEAGDARTYEQVLIPNDSTASTIPPVRFSYFDPQNRRYEAVESQPIALVVRPPSKAPKAEVFAGGSAPHAAPNETLGRDIVYIKDDPGAWMAQRTSWYGGPLFLLWQPVPLLLLGAAVWYDRRRQRLTGDVRYARFSRAGKEARRGLAVAESALRRGETGAFYDAISRTMQAYLAAKLDLPPGAISADAAAQRGVPADCVRRIAEFLARCEVVRFAPSEHDGDLRGALALGQEIVRRLEHLRGLAPGAEVNANRGRPGSLLAVCLLAAGALWAQPASAVEPTEPSPQTTFYHAGALYRDGQYTAAAREYETLLQAGWVSGNIYFNLGNAYFKAGERGKAILNYERARRLLPADPDLAANLQYAQSQTGSEPCPPSLWAAVFFPLAHRLSARPLLWLTSALYTLLLMLLAAFRLWPNRPRWYRYTTAGTGLLLLVSGTSLVYRLVSDDWQRQAVVIRSGETPARFEPAANGTVHFVLKEGTLIRVAERRENWIEVARCDGRRGWIEQQAAAER